MEKEDTRRENIMNLTYKSFVIYNAILTELIQKILLTFEVI